jgi:hypothetical protein
MKLYLIIVFFEKRTVWLLDDMEFAENIKRML